MPKTPANIKSLARAHTESAVNVLKNIANNRKAPPSSRVAAATALLDRGWGRPAQVHSGDEDGGPLVIQIVKYGDDPDTE